MVRSVEWLEPGLDGLEQTRQRLQEAIDEGARHWLTIKRAEELVARVPPWDEEAQVRELFNYFIGLHGFPYRKDPVDVQVVERAPSRPAGGDCKKYTVQLGAYVQALGMPVEVKIVGQTAPAAGRPPRFHHVYIRALVNGRWVALDPTLHRPTHGVYAEAGDELDHAIERTYSMLGFAAANNALGDFDFFGAIRSIGYALDPTRKEGITRGLIQALPGGTGIIAAADTAAAIRKGIAAATATPAPATALTLAPAGTKVDASQAAEGSGEGETTARLAKDLANSSGGGGSALPGEQEPEKKGGISAGMVVGGVVATGVVGGLILAVARAGKRKKR